MSVNGDPLEGWVLLEESDTESEHSSSQTNSLVSEPSCLPPSHQSSSHVGSNDSDSDEDEDLQMALALSLKHKPHDQHSNRSQEVESGGSNLCWYGQVQSGSTFSAQWQVHLDGVEDETLLLDVWADRTFLPIDCDGDCVHRQVVLEQGSSTIHNGLDYSVRVSHLQAPSETGRYFEVWRLRNIFGHLLGPILEIHLDVIPKEIRPSDGQSRPKRIKRETTPPNETSTAQVDIIDHGPLPKRDKTEIPMSTSFRYTWKLRNSGQSAWTPPFALERRNPIQTTDVEAQFAITNEYRRLIVGPIPPNAVVNLTVSGLRARNSVGLQEEEYRLTSASTSRVLADDLPLRVHVVSEPIVPPAYESDTEAYKEADKD